MYNSSIEVTIEGSAAEQLKDAELLTINSSDRVFKMIPGTVGCYGPRYSNNISGMRYSFRALLEECKNATDMPSRTDMEKAIEDYGNAIYDDLDPTEIAVLSNRIRLILDRIYEGT